MKQSVNSWRLDQTIVPWAGGRGLARYNRLIPDGEVGVKDVQWVAAAVGFWVWTRKHSSEHEQFTPKHAAAVVGQRRNLPLSLEETRKGGGGMKKGSKNELKTSKTHATHLHHGPFPALRVQDVNVVEPLFVLRSPKYKDSPWVRVVDSCVADPGLRCRTLCQGLCCNPGRVLCWTETKTLALTWRHRKMKTHNSHWRVKQTNWPVQSFHMGSLQNCILAPCPPIRIAVWTSMGHRVWPQRPDGLTNGPAGKPEICFF